MKKQYIQPTAEVFELALDGLVMDNSIPSGGEIEIGGTGAFDASQRRNNSWNEYEN